MQEPTIKHSAIVDQILCLDPDSYQELAPQKGPSPEARKVLEGLTLNQLFPCPITSPVDAYAALAGLWLWNDGLDGCHQIVQQSPEELFSAALNLHSKVSNASKNVPFVQSVETQNPNDSRHFRELEVTLAYWHGIMHRREPDYGNAKYWFHRVPQHSIFDSLAHGAAELAANHEVDAPAQFLTSETTWNPFRFVDLCAAIARGQSQCEALALKVAELEWQLLFDYCYRQAVA